MGAVTVFRSLLLTVEFSDGVLYTSPVVEYTAEVPCPKAVVPGDPVDPVSGLVVVVRFCLSSVDVRGFMSS